MSTVILNIKDIIGSPSALTREQGELVLAEIKRVFGEGDKVVLDFVDIESIITPFLNVAIGKLYMDNTSEQIKETLEIQNVPKGKVASFNLVIENAKRYYANQHDFCQTVKDVIG